MSLEKAVEDVKSLAEARGFKIEEGEGRIKIVHDRAPIAIEVSISGERAVVELKVEKGLEEYIDEVLGEDEDPREALEESLDDMVRLVDLIVSRLEREGLNVRRLTREAILDVYDALESRLEEA